MLGRKRWTAAGAVAGVLLLGGLATATSQEAARPDLSADSLAAELELDDEARAELEQLVELMGRRHDARRRMGAQMEALRTEMHGLMSSLRKRLTPEQAAELHRAMRRSMAASGGMHGARAGHRHGGATGAHRAGSMMHGAGAMHGAGPMHGAGGWMHADCPFVAGEGGDTPGSGS